MTTVTTSGKLVYGNTNLKVVTLFVSHYIIIPVFILQKWKRLLCNFVCIRTEFQHTLLLESISNLILCIIYESIIHFKEFTQQRTYKYVIIIKLLNSAQRYFRHNMELLSKHKLHILIKYLQIFQF